MNIILKTKKLFKEKKHKELSNKISNYIFYKISCLWFNLTLKEIHPDLKKTNKDWVIYTYLKSKYRNFLKNYKTYHNETHEYSDIIWWCWFQGKEKAPEISKKCLESLKRNMTGKKIIEISYENMFDYATLPEFIIAKWKKNRINNAHFSDLLRLQLLLTHGGTWIDATCFCTNRPDYVFNKPLFVFQTREKNDPGIIAQNWFISCEKNEPILALTRDLLFEYWRKHNSAIHYFIFYFFFNLAAEKYPEEWKNVPWYPDLPPHMMQRELFNEYSDERFEELKRFSDIHKLSYKLEMPQSTTGTLWEKLLNFK